MRGTYDNSWNRQRTRIDGRNQSDPAVQAGMRKIHRSMDGSVIGGETAEGYGVGTRAGKLSNRSNPFASMPDRPSMDSFAGGGPVTAPVAPLAPVAASRPNALGGGLSRWERLNPNAGRFGKERAVGAGETRVAPVVAAKAFGPVRPSTVVAAAPLGPKLPAGGMLPTVEQGNAQFDVKASMGKRLKDRYAAR